MITFVFDVRNEHRGGGVAGQLEVLTRVKGSIEASSSSLPCPIHGAGSSASILLRGTDGKYELKILNSCCEEFRRAVESELAFRRNETGPHVAV